MSKRPRIKSSMIAASSNSHKVRRIAKPQGKSIIDQITDLPVSETPRYYIWFLGKLKEIQSSQIDMYLAGGFEIIEK